MIEVETCPLRDGSKLHCMHSTAFGMSGNETRVRVTSTEVCCFCGRSQNNDHEYDIEPPPKHGPYEPR